MPNHELFQTLYGRSNLGVKKTKIVQHLDILLSWSLM